MAPESLQGRPCPASDQYSQAIVLYEWLSGDCPFHGSFSEIASQQVLVLPPPIKAPAVSPEVEAVILRGLAKDPQQRSGIRRRLRAGLYGRGRDLQGWY